jgi:methylmalonyl-CoA mutase cobalamin-binding subunit
MKSMTFWVCETCEKESLIQIAENGNSFCFIDPNSIISALDKHPRGFKRCNGCQSCADAQVVTTGTFSTPGCFVTGGQQEERNCLVIQARCDLAAQKITKMFEAGAIKDGTEYIIIGANQKYQPNLHSLMLHIIRTGRIDTNTIMQAQRMNHGKESEAQPDHCN